MFRVPFFFFFFSSPSSSWCCVVYVEHLLYDCRIPYGFANRCPAVDSSSPCVSAVTHGPRTTGWWTCNKAVRQGITPKFDIERWFSFLSCRAGGLERVVSHTAFIRVARKRWADCVLLFPESSNSLHLPCYVKGFSPASLVLRYFMPLAAPVTSSGGGIHALELSIRRRTQNNEKRGEGIPLPASIC
ncbi:hypothetical protein BKA67DRAFT_164248 [Truncatella angustata]|uniref:Secreted protein n=1 Tax=Truncatella angustata TaxID=152316 RepID=A0A9P8UQP0_9PEZI|nr:uncharacterized protein BKA67DRAFT_164248 [Truncatella angustata]KAH6656697.1 hypothetical protein BKA67DRAFT_164248 [Truncatella angustata]